MKLCIVQGGQTGVDRGAFLGAIDACFEVDGYVPKDRSDEAGLIPGDVVRRLRVCPRAGLFTRTMNNVDMSAVVIVLLENAEHPYATPGTLQTLQYARKAKKPRVLIDPSMPVAHVRRVLWDALGRAPQHVTSATEVMLAGPRASRWADGEQFARAFVNATLVEALGAIDGLA